MMDANKQEQETRDKYFKALGLSGEEEEQKIEKKRALFLAHEIRKFEIDLYWRRATYFWGFQIVLFAALGYIISKASEDWLINFIVCVLALLGFSVSLGWEWANHGSRFWQRNWERHIDFLEDQFTGRLYKTILAEKGFPLYSVSRVNNKISLLFVIAWGVIAIALAIKNVGWIIAILPNWLIYIALPVFILGFVGFLFWTHSEVKVDLKKEESVFLSENITAFLRKASGRKKSG
jgi:hypothetical protein